MDAAMRTPDRRPFERSINEKRRLCETYVVQRNFVANAICDHIHANFRSRVSASRKVAQTLVPSITERRWRDFVNSRDFENINYDKICKLAAAFGIDPLAVVASGYHKMEERRLRDQQKRHVQSGRCVEVVA